MKPSYESDYWYDHRDRLGQGDVCILKDGSVVKLDCGVPGDGTDWYVLDWSESSQSWIDERNRIHPGDIKKGPQW